MDAALSVLYCTELTTNRPSSFPISIVTSTGSSLYVIPFSFLPVASSGTVSFIWKVYLPSLLNIMFPNVAVFLVAVAVSFVWSGSFAPFSGLLSGSQTLSVNSKPSAGQSASGTTVSPCFTCFVIFGAYVAFATFLFMNTITSALSLSVVAVVFVYVSVAGVSLVQSTSFLETFVVVSYGSREYWLSPYLIVAVSWISCSLSTNTSCASVLLARSNT